MFTLTIIFCVMTVSNTKITLSKNISTSKTQSTRAHLRIHLGTDAKPSEYTFVVLLSSVQFIYVTRLCTGAMITEDWGISAAHCERYKYLDSFSVWYGNYTERPQTTKMFSKVVEMITHPSYRLLTTDGGQVDLLVSNDICLFRTESKLNMDSYGRLSSVDRATMIGLPVTYVGGGMTARHYVYEDMLRPLQVGEAAIITCSKEMIEKSKYIMCITPKCSKRLQRPWYSDSGGPLIYDGQIVGVCSYGIDHKLMTIVGYVPISPYIEWIYDVMHPK